MHTLQTVPSALYREALQAGIDYATIPLPKTGLILLQTIARRATIALLAAEGQDAIERLRQEMRQFLKEEELREWLRRVFAAHHTCTRQDQEELELEDQETKM